MDIAVAGRGGDPTYHYVEAESTGKAHIYTMLMENGNGISRDIHFIANGISPFQG